MVVALCGCERSDKTDWRQSETLQLYVRLTSRMNRDEIESILGNPSRISEQSPGVFTAYYVKDRDTYIGRTKPLGGPIMCDGEGIFVRYVGESALVIGLNPEYIDADRLDDFERDVGFPPMEEYVAAETAWSDAAMESRRGGVNQPPNRPNKSE